MTTQTTLSPSTRRLSPLLSPVLVTACLLVGCGPDPQQVFQAGVAKDALACMHPRGVFQGASDFKDEGNGIYAGTIHWKGAALENEHTTRVRFKIEEGVAKVYLVEDSAFLPAAQQTCEIPIVAND